MSDEIMKHLEENVFPIVIEKDPILFMKRTIPMGKYDINYVIMLLRVILDKCNDMRHNPHDFQFTLQQSLLSLIGMLEVERDQNG